MMHEQQYTMERHGGREKEVGRDGLRVIHCGSNTVLMMRCEQLKIHEKPPHSAI